MNKDLILEKLWTLTDPIAEKSFKELDSVKHVGINEEGTVVSVVIELAMKTPEAETHLSRQIAKIIKLDLGFTGVKISFEERKDNSPKRTRYIGIASGKGGVGKSTVTANLAYALKQIGKKVGIIDADIYGSSIPKIFDATDIELEANSEQKIFPVVRNGIEIIASAYFVEDDKPIMWRGPMLNRLLNHFVNDVLWNEDLDYMLIDLPPGTGDVAMDIQKHFPDMDILLVTTPHPNASHVAVKAGFAAQQLNHKVIGVVENMSYYFNNANGMQEFLFGHGGGMQVADTLDTKMIAQIPIGMPLLHHSLFEMNEKTGLIFLGLAKQIIQKK